LNLEQKEHPVETLLAGPEDRKRRLGAGSIDGAAAMKSLLEKIPPLESTVTEDTLKALSLQILAMQETLSKLVNHGHSARE
jgi:hypothetical protein